MRQQHRKERRCRVEDRGKPAGDALLTVDDETEGDDVVEEAHAHEGEQNAPVERKTQAHGRQDQMERERGDGDAQEDDS